MKIPTVDVSVDYVGLPDEVARDLWVKLSDRMCVFAGMTDPLTKAERDLYDTLTALLTERAKIVSIAVQTG